ncbi:MAG TPA: hypothetical protein VK673_11370 [Chthoniobacterales bacterium]|nr:hypothetical protein [Chthoniobacterales bacterium]
MKTIITSSKPPPVRRVLCSFLFGAATFCLVPTNIQAAGDIVWVTLPATSTTNSIAKYKANGTAINTNFITEETTIGAPGGILVSGHDLYVPTDWWACCPNKAFLYALLKGEAYYLFFTYDAGAGNVIDSVWYKLIKLPFVPGGMALSGTNLYVANQEGSIAKGGDLYFINSNVTSPYALAVNGLLNVLYVTNNAQNSNGDFYISTYTADTGALINANFIQIQTGGLYGLALRGNVLYVSVFSGSAPGVYTYKADTGELIKGPFVSVNEPWGIAIGGKTLYVASYQNSVIYEYNATTGAQLSDSIKLSGAPTNITVEPADEQ